MKKGRNPQEQSERREHGFASAVNKIEGPNNETLNVDLINLRAGGGEVCGRESRVRPGDLHPPY